MIRGMKVRPMEEMQEFVKDNNIDIAVLTIPKESAVATAEKLVGMGIKAIWNFAHVDLEMCIRDRQRSGQLYHLWPSCSEYGYDYAG